MKKAILTFFFTLFYLLLIHQKSWSQNPENWTANQLIEPCELAGIILADEDVPVIFSVGPGAIIPKSIDIGMTNNKANIEKLKNRLSGLSKDDKIIVYCGCCPFAHCPNVRPAIDALKEMKFTSYKLLNLPNNVKTDWIDKGYPFIKQ